MKAIFNNVQRNCFCLSSINVLFFFFLLAIASYFETISPGQLMISFVILLTCPLDMVWML